VADQYPKGEGDTDQRGIMATCRPCVKAPDRAFSQAAGAGKQCEMRPLPPVANLAGPTSFGVEIAWLSWPVLCGVGSAGHRTHRLSGLVLRQ